MRNANSPFAGSPVVAWLFAAGLVAIPFDATPGIGFLGELGYELSFPFFALASCFAVFILLAGGGVPPDRSLVLRIGSVMLLVVSLSYLANLSDINTAVFRERRGFGKFATSLLVIVYGLALAWLAEQFDPRHYTTIVARFVCWSALIASIYFAFEFFGTRGLLGGLYSQIDQLIHSRQADVINAWDGRVNEKVLYGWDQRLRSVSFEPPAFGNYTGFAWPWVWYSALKAPPERRLRAWALLAFFTLVILFSASRTGLIMLGANVAIIAVFTSIYTRGTGNSESAAAARLVLPIVALLTLGLGASWTALNFDEVVQSLMLGDSVSNISRLGFQIAALQMFQAHPLFGVGLGQSAFHMVEFVPSWIFQSPEAAPTMIYPAAPWPNVYSVYARLAAEMGFVGLLGWTVLWPSLAFKLASDARAVSSPDGALISYHHPVILNCLGVLVSGIATDTFRTPMIWVALGLSCSILVRSRRARPTASASFEAPDPELALPRSQQ